MEEVLEVGSWNRVCGSTEQNPDSSRSHCIFTIEYELWCLTDDNDGNEHFRSGMCGQFQGRSGLGLAKHAEESKHSNNLAS